MKTSLERILTKDGLWLDGLSFFPNHKSIKGIVWIHGLFGNYGGRRIKTLAEISTKNNIAFVSFNTRGAGVMSRFSIKTKINTKYKNRKTIGGGLENFQECIWDIEAMIQFLRRKGIKKIFLIGHSTGANKALFYMYKQNDRRVTGIGLIGPINDYVSKKQELGRRYTFLIKKVKILAKKKPNKLLPYSLSPVSITAARYLSLYTPATPEDVFPYYNKQAKFKELASISIPLLVLIGEQDEYLDRKPQDFINIFKIKAKSTKKFTGLIIKSADHGFYEKEKQLAQTIISWIKKL